MAVKFKRVLRVKRPKVDKYRFYDVIIYAARGSHSARRLASSLSCRRWRDDLPERYSRRRPYFRGNRSPLVINWGSTCPATWLSDPRFRLTPRWINDSKACERAINKQSFFNALNGNDAVPILKYTTDIEAANKWLKKGYGVVVRKTVTGSGGAGIIVVQPGGVLPQAPLYTRYYPKTHEFRAHIWNGKLIDFTQKKLKGGPNEAADRTIRNLDNGWIHAHADLSVSQQAVGRMGEASVACIRALGLHFGACDILGVVEHGELKSFRICEVNTGPGLENTETINAYSKAILEEKNRA